MCGLTRVLGLEVRLALQRGGQVVEAERQLPLEGRVLLAQSWKSPERSLTHQLLDGRVATGNGVGSARLCPLHGGCCTLRWGGCTRWKGRNNTGLIWNRKTCDLMNCFQESCCLHFIKKTLKVDDFRILITFLLLLQLVVSFAAAALVAGGGIHSE